MTQIWHLNHLDTSKAARRKLFGNVGSGIALSFKATDLWHYKKCLTLIVALITMAPSISFRAVTSYSKIQTITQKSKYPICVWLCLTNQIELCTDSSRAVRKYYPRSRDFLAPGTRAEELVPAVKTGNMMTKNPWELQWNDVFQFSHLCWPLMC